LVNIERRNVVNQYMEFTCQSYYFLLSFFLLSGAQQREHKELAPDYEERITEENKGICEPEVSAQRKDLEVKGTALTLFTVLFSILSCGL